MLGFCFLDVSIHIRSLCEHSAFFLSGIAVSCGKSMCNFLKWLCHFRVTLVMDEGCCFSCQHLLPVVSSAAALAGVEQSLTVVLLCASLMTDDVEHLCMCLFISSPYIFFAEMFVQIFCPFGLCFGKWYNDISFLIKAHTFISTVIFFTCATQHCDICGLNISYILFSLFLAKFYGENCFPQT